MAAKKLSTAQKAAKAVDKARGRVTYFDTKSVYGSNLSPKMKKAKSQVERAAKAGAKITSKDYGNRYSESASKTDVAASSKKTLKASGTGFKSTARQVKLERERTTTRAAAMAKKAKKK